MQEQFTKTLIACALVLLCSIGCRNGGGAPEGGVECPENMARIPGMNACIDRYEAAVRVIDGKEVAVCRKGALPASKTSFRQAREACRNAGKRMCTLKEWEAACGGKEKRTYPYGDEFRKRACNCVYLYEDPTSAAVRPAGSMPECTTPEGVFDLSGNLWEWVDEKGPSESLRMLRGGGFSNQDYLLNCETRKDTFQPIDEAHGGYGFRCCASLAR